MQQVIHHKKQRVQMPKIAKELTVLEIKRLGQGTFAIGGVKGLYIRKTPTQTLFILRYSDATGRHDFSLGSFPETSVAAARKAAREARALIDKGGSPIEEREGQRKAKREAKEAALREVEKSKLTFEAVALEWISDRAKNGFWSKNLRGEKDTRQILARHLFPVIGSKTLNTSRRKTSARVWPRSGRPRLQSQRKPELMPRRFSNGQSPFINGTTRIIRP